MSVTKRFVLGAMSLLLAASPSLAFNLVPSPNGPAEHSSMIGGWTWRTPVAHDEKPPVDCNGPAAPTSSQCRFTYTVPQDVLDSGAQFLIIRVKAKALVPGGTHNDLVNSGLIYASFHNPGQIMNLFIHVDAFGGGNSFQNINRRVTYSQIFAPIIDGEIAFNIGKRIIGEAEAEMAFYYEGYLR